MSTSIDTSFVRQYERDVHMIFQREGGYLRPTVRMKTDVRGSSTTFQKIGKGVATTKARHGVVTPMNQDHTAIQCTLEDFYAPDYVDKLDEAKVNHDERMAIAKGGAWALGRKVDDQIITVLDTTSESEVTVTVTSSAAVRNGLLEAVEALVDNDVANDGAIYALLTPRLWSQAMTVEEFASSDYVGANGQSFVDGFQGQGKWKDWMNVKWAYHTALPGKGTGTAKSFVWHKNAVGFATGAHPNNAANGEAVGADVWWDGNRQAHLITHSMSGGACLIDTTGVIEMNSDDTTAIATS